MTFDQLRSLNPCRSGLDFATRFTSVKVAWLNCTKIPHLLWFALKQTKRKDLIVLFAKECADRALNRDVAYSRASYNCYKGALDDEDDYCANASHCAHYSAQSADVYNGDDCMKEEIKIQRERIYELFTDIIFPPN